MIAYDGSVKYQIRLDRVAPGDGFLAIRHYKYDGNKHIAEAFSKGAHFAVVEKDKSSQNDDHKILGAHGKIIEVPSLRTFVLDHLRQIRKANIAKIFVVTGSLGKSSAVALIAQHLKEHYSVCYNQGNFNNLWGVYDTVLNAPFDVDWVVLEVGAQKKGELNEIVGALSPDVVLVTNVDKVHVHSFGGSLDDVIKGKSEALQAAGPDATWIVPEGVFSHLRSKSRRTLIFKSGSWESMALALGEYFETKPPSITLSPLRLGEFAGALAAPTLLDLSCTSAPALKNFFYRLKDPKNFRLVSAGLTEAWDEFDKHELICLARQVKVVEHFKLIGATNCLAELNPEWPIPIGIDSPDELRQRIDTTSGVPIVFQDCRSRWSKPILRFLDREDLFSQLFPPF